MISVLITLLNDSRVKFTVDSLLNQTLLPEEIFIADGGSTEECLNIVQEYQKKYPNMIKLKIIPGSVVRTRKYAVKEVTGNIIAFIDSDEVAPPFWLETLTKPLNFDFDFTGGPTKPLTKESSKIEKWINERDEYLYENVISKDLTMLPMGNSAWKRKIFEQIEFDETLSGGGEDYDINIRALNAGFKGVFVREAFLYHNQSDISSIRKYIKKRFRYLILTAKVYSKNKNVNNKLFKSLHLSLKFKSPLDFMDLILKPLAFIFANVKK